MNSVSGVIVPLAILALSAEAGSLADVKHLMIFMQENRPFDHYFGTLKGVRGFNDRTPVMLKSGRDAFWQPLSLTDDEQYMLPFRTVKNETNAMCMPAPEMYYPTDIKIWNEGRMDAWNTARDPGYGMAYFTREDLPYYYTLYDNFLVGDHYHQSTFTCTNPNRMHLFTGSNGLSVNQGCILENEEPRPGYNWTTAAELLVAKNISWRVYQQYDNFDDNAFAWFNSFQSSSEGDILHDQGMARQKSLIATLEEDMTKGNLPTVSWIIAPTRKSEHATNHPCAGEDFTARVSAVLQKHPEIYKNTVFVLNYDEGGQFFDHAFTPTAPVNDAKGYSSVTTVGEVNTEVLTSEPNPIGLGFRVPLLIVSPWTRGNIVNSEVMDHTSVLQFMESWLDIEVSNISPWRRLVTGNMLSAFDFANPDYTWPTDFPDTSEYVSEGDTECRSLPDPIIPSIQSMPSQEPGTRISRALPYETQVMDSGVSATGTLTLSIVNSGSAGVPLVLFDLINLATVSPRQYALAPNTSFIYQDTLSLNSANEEYAYALMGPNGFLREFRGSVSNKNCNGVSASLSYCKDSEEVIVTLMNPSSSGAQQFVIKDIAYGLLNEDVMQVTVGAQETESIRINTAASGHWYDLVVSVSSSTDALDTSCMYRRFMGRMETGKDSISDPAMGVGKANWIALLQDQPAHKKTMMKKSVKKDDLYVLPENITKLHRKPTIHAREDKDARFYSKDFSAGNTHVEL